MSMSTAALVATVVMMALATLFLLTTRAPRDKAAVPRHQPQPASQHRDHRDQAGQRRGRFVEQQAALERHVARPVVVPASAPPPHRAPVEPEALGVTRRQFLNRSIVNFFAVGLGGFGAASLGFLWPILSGGFGSKIKAGKLDDVVEQIRSTKEPFYLAAARTWISLYPSEAVGKAEKVYTGAVLEGMNQGVVALYQKCPHLGCRVPWCKAAQWFECPCHGSKFNRVGEKKAGPAPRGMDRFGLSVDGGILAVDTKQVIQGPPIGTNTTGQEAEGPHCA